MEDWEINCKRAQFVYEVMKEDLKKGEEAFLYLFSKYKEDPIFYFYRGKGYKKWYSKTGDENFKRKAIEDFKRAYEDIYGEKWREIIRKELEELGVKWPPDNETNKIEEIIKAVEDERKRIEDIRNRQPYFAFSLSKIYEETHDNYGKVVCFVFENFHERIEIDLSQRSFEEDISYFKFGERYLKGYTKIVGGKLKVYIPLKMNFLDDSEIFKFKEIAENEGIYYISDFRESTDRLKDFLVKRKSDKNKFLGYFLNEIKKPKFLGELIGFNENILKGLTTSHIEAIKRALSQEIVFIWGPPGTGKTEVLCNITRILFENDYRILLISLSNNTVDDLLRKFVKKFKYEERKGEIIRLGKERPSTPPEIKKFFSKKILHTARVVACNFNNIIFRKKFPMFDFVLMDEVSMTPIPYIVAASYLAKKGIILAGDPFQLPPPYPKDMEMPNEWYSKNIFEKIGVSFENFEEILIDKRCVFLDTQFRMSEEISNLVSELFYKNKLKCGKEKDILNVKKRVFFLDSFGKLEIGEEGLQRRNEMHAKAIVNYIEKLLNRLKELQISLKIGIITPYNSQVCTIYKYLKEKNLSENSSIKVGTVHSFQGQEADIIFFDITDVSVEPSPLILDKKLLNVALSRAKEALIIVGNKDYLLNSVFFDKEIREIYKKIIEIGEKKVEEDITEWIRPM